MATKFNRIYSIAKDWGLGDSEAHAVAHQMLWLIDSPQENYDESDCISELHIALEGEGWEENDIAEIEGLAMDIYDILYERWFS